MLFNPKYKAVGLIALPYSLIYELLAPVFILLGIAVIAASIAMNMINFYSYILLTIIYLVFGITLTATTYLNRIYLSYDKLNKNDILKLNFYSVFDLLFIRMFLILINTVAYFKLNQTKKGWVSPKRIANNIAS